MRLYVFRTVRDASPMADPTYGPPIAVLALNRDEAWARAARRASVLGFQADSLIDID